MRIAVIGGAGAMGSVLGARLFEGGHDVTLVDVSEPAVQAINERGLHIVTREGRERIVAVPATTDLATIAPVKLALVFVKCYHTDAAITSAAPLLGPKSDVLTLQNGWGNADRIAAHVGAERVLAGVTYHSATTLGPGRVRHAGEGMTFLGEISAPVSDRVRRIAEAFRAAGLPVTPSDAVLDEIWKKLALNVVTLPTQASIGLTADRLLDTPEMTDLMRGLLREVVTVAAAQGIHLDFEERWAAITGLLSRLAPNTKGSMLQDVENRRRTEIDVINGAITAACRRARVPAPLNEAMVALIKAKEAAYPAA
jgi:2-dehydropantoate 2-reductase